MTPQTIADAGHYWERYYSGEFIFGLGTEHILTALQQLPSAGTWLDLGSGSESLLWSIALDAQRLVAVDLDPHRLNLLRDYAAACEPRGAYQAVLDLCGRSRRHPVRAARPHPRPWPVPDLLVDLPRFPRRRRLGRRGELERNEPDRPCPALPAALHLRVHPEPYDSAAHRARSHNHRP